MRLLSVSSPSSDGLVGTVNDLIAKAPTLVNKFKSFFSKKGKDEAPDADFEIDDEIIDIDDDLLADTEKDQ